MARTVGHALTPAEAAMMRDVAQRVLNARGPNVRNVPGGLFIGEGPDRSRNTGVAVGRFRVKSVEGDYIVCRFIEGEHEGTVDVKIAKPFLLQKTPFDGVSRSGVTYTYTDDATTGIHTIDVFGTDGNQQRIATLDSDTTDKEFQVIVPRYRAAVTGGYEGDIIVAMRGMQGGPAAVVDPGYSYAQRIDWLDLNVDGRTWCEDNTNVEDD